MTTSLAVVIPTYGRVESLRRLLESLAAQTRAADETIVVDQNARGLLDPTLAPFRVTRIVLDTPNASAARNAGFLASTATHILFLDDDETIAPDFIERLMMSFAQHVEVRALWPVVHPRGANPDSAIHALQQRALGPPIDGTTIFPIIRAGCGGFAIERAHFAAAGGYDELLFAFGRMSEDWELSDRMRRRGLAIFGNTSLFVQHDGHFDGGCAIRTSPLLEIRLASARATLLRQRIAGGPPFRLRLRDVLPIIRFTLLSSFGRRGARLALLRTPLASLRVIARAIRESRELLAAHGHRYAAHDRIDHLRGDRLSS